MSERDSIAKAFHNLYLVTAKAFSWPVHEEVDVLFEELPKDAQELDYAFAEFHLNETARLRAQVERLTAALHDAEAIGDFALELRDRLALKEGAEAAWTRVRELERERDEARAQVATLVQAIERQCFCMEHERELHGLTAARDKTGLHLIVDKLPDEARALLYRIANLEGQIKKLADFIMANIPGEPSMNEGAVDTSIRLMKRLQLTEAVVEAARKMRECTKDNLSDAHFINLNVRRNARDEVYEMDYIKQLFQALAAWDSIKDKKGRPGGLIGL